MVLTEQWFPFNYRDNSGNIVGSSTETVEKIMSIAGLDYEISQHSWKDAYLAVRKEPDALIYTIFKTPQRESLFHWLCPISSEIVNSVYALKDSKIEINGGGDIKKYLVGATQDSYPHHALVELGSIAGDNLQLTSSNQYNIDRLLKKRVQLIVETENAIETILKLKGLPSDTVKKVYTLDRDNKVDACIAINKNMPIKTVTKLKKAHKTLMQSRAQN